MMCCAFLLLLPLVSLGPAAAAAAAAGSPSIETRNGTLQLVIPANSSVQVVFQDESGGRLAPLSLALAADLLALRDSMQTQIAALRDAFATLSAQVAGKVDAGNLTVIEGKVAAVVQAMVGGTPANNTLQAALSARLAAGPACQCFDPRALAGVNASVTALAGNVTALSTGLGGLQQTSAFFVDTRNLSSIVGTAASVATVAVGPALGALNGSLLNVSGSLAAFQTQAAAVFVDRRNLSTVDPQIVAVVGGLVAGQPSGNTLSAILTAKANVSQLAPLLQCTSATPLPALANGSVVACGAGTFNNGATCAPSCNAGYTLFGTLVCAAGVWTGSAVCNPNLCATVLLPPVNGAVSTTVGVTGTVAVFSCAAGFSPIGPSSSTCQPTGQWSVTTPPACVANGQTAVGALSGGCRDPMVTVTGLYFISVALLAGGSTTVQVYCRVDADGSKWLLFQRRTDTTDFYQPWNTYVAGFGGPPSLNNVNGNSFWLGLELLYQITRSGSWRLRVDLQNTVNNFNATALYSTFSIGPGSSNYVLNVGGYSGTAGDAIASAHNGQPFSTFDRDNDQWPSNCAVTFRGAWWYTACHSSNLNGVYYPGCHYNYADGTDWCGGTNAWSFPGDQTRCSIPGMPSPTAYCHHNSLKVWMMLG